MHTVCVILLLAPPADILCVSRCKSAIVHIISFPHLVFFFECLALSFRTQQRIIATAEDSVLRTEMDNLEPQDEDAPKLVLSFKPMS